MTTPILNNRLTDMAERAGCAWRASKAAADEAAERAIEAGRLLAAAREEAPHGTWAAFLERAQMSDQQAQRLMRIARAGLKPVTVTGLGGIKATLNWLATRRLPAQKEVLLASTDRFTGGLEGALAAVWEDQPGYYHVVCRQPGGLDTPFDTTRRPVSGKTLYLGDGVYWNPVWDTLADFLGDLEARACFYRVGWREPRPSVDDMMCELSVRQLTLDEGDRWQDHVFRSLQNGMLAEGIPSKLPRRRRS